MALLPWLAALPPLVLALCLASWAVNIPYTDQWHIASLFIKYHEGALSLADFIAPHAEHRIVLPRVIILTLGLLSHWNVRWEMGLTFFLACAFSLLVLVLLRRSLRPCPAPRLGCLLVAANLLLFSPLQHANWLAGLHFAIWLPMVCLGAALVVQQIGIRPGWRAAGSLVAALAASLSFSNGMFTWLLLAPGLFIHRPWGSRRSVAWRSIVWAVGMFLCAVFYLREAGGGVGRTPYEFAFSHPGLTVRFVLAFLGSAFAFGSTTAAAIAGGVGMAVLAWSVIHLSMNPRRMLLSRLLPWLAIAGYTILSAFAAACGRTMAGLGTAMSSRYVFYSACFCVAVMAVLAVLWKDGVLRRGVTGHGGVKRALARCAYACVVVLAIVSSATGLPRMRSSYDARAAAKAALVLMNTRVEEKLLVPELFYETGYLADTARQLDTLGLIHPPLLPATAVSTFFTLPEDPARGWFDGAVLLPETGTVKVWGRLADAARGRLLRGVAVAALGPGSSGKVVAICPVRDLAAGQKGILGRARCQTWEGRFHHAELPAGEAILVAIGLDEKSGDPHRLAGHHAMDREGDLP